MRPLSKSSQTVRAPGISEITKCRSMAHLWLENGKAGSLDPIPLNYFSFLYFSKSCWYNLDHLQHLHLQSVLWSTEFYEYFTEQTLTAGLGLGLGGKEGVPGECPPNASAGAWLAPDRLHLSACSGKESWNSLWPTLPLAPFWVQSLLECGFIKLPDMVEDTTTTTTP